jgi:hypothetical protein
VDEHELDKRPGWPDEQSPSRLHQKPNWLAFALLIALVVVILVLLLVLLGPQIRPIYNQGLGNL